MDDDIKSWISSYKATIGSTEPWSCFHDGKIFHLIAAYLLDNLNNRKRKLPFDQEIVINTTSLFNDILPSELLSDYCFYYKTRESNQYYLLARMLDSIDVVVVKDMFWEFIILLAGLSDGELYMDNFLAGIMRIPLERVNAYGPYLRWNDMVLSDKLGIVGTGLGTINLLKQLSFATVDTTNFIKYLTTFATLCILMNIAHLDHHENLLQSKSADIVNQLKLFL